MDMGLIVTIGIELIAAAVMVGVFKQKVENNEKNSEEIKADCLKKIEEIKADFNREIDELKKRQDKTDSTFTAIQSQLNEILSQQSYIKGRVDMLIDGKGK